MMFRYAVAFDLMTVWSGGKMLVLINIIGLHLARLVLGWVTVCRQASRLAM